MKQPKASWNATRKKWEAKGVNRSSGKRQSYYGSTPEEAVRNAVKSFGIADESTLYGYYDKVYLPTVLHKSKNWLDQIGWAMDTHIIPKFGTRPIESITRAELQVFFNNLTGMKVISRQKVKKVLSAVLNLAVQDEIITTNPASAVRLPPIEEADKTALMPEELRQLWLGSHDLIKPFVLLAGFCGLRLGEALAVRRADVKTGVIHVRTQIQPDGKEHVETPNLKTKQSKRDIPLPKGLQEALLNCNQKNDIWICSNTEGGRIRYKNVIRELKIACAYTQVPVVSPHELRHTFASILESEIEAPRPVVQSLLGHAGSGITDGYTHTWPQTLEKWMEKYWDNVSTDLQTVICLQEAK